MTSYPVIAQIYLLSSGIGSLTLVLSAASGVLHHHDGSSWSDASGDYDASDSHHLATVPPQRRLPIALLSCLNPTTISAAATWFGATGIALWRLTPLALEYTLPLATLGGIIGARITATIVASLAKRLFASHTFRSDDIIGLQGEISVPVNHDGLGEVVYVKGGRRYTASARATNQTISLKRGARAIICDIRDDVAYVEPWEENEHE